MSGREGEEKGRGGRKRKEKRQEEKGQEEGDEWEEEKTRGIYRER